MTSEKVKVRGGAAAIPTPTHVKMISTPSISLFTLFFLLREFVTEQRQCLRRETRTRNTHLGNPKKIGGEPEAQNVLLDIARIDFQNFHCSRVRVQVKLKDFAHLGGVAGAKALLAPLDDPVETRTIHN